MHATKYTIHVLAHVPMTMPPTTVSATVSRDRKDGVPLSHIMPAKSVKMYHPRANATAICV